MSDNIPFDIQINIMNRLPVKSLLQFCTVSKQWKFSIDNSNFIHNYGFRERNTCCFNLTYKQDIEGFVYSVDENLALTHVDSNLFIFSLTPIATSEGVWHGCQDRDLTCDRFCLSKIEIVIDIPEKIGVGKFSPPYYISHLGNSLIISRSFSFDDFHIIYAWALEVDDGFVSSYRQIFTLPYPAEHEKLDCAEEEMRVHLQPIDEPLKTFRVQTLRLSSESDTRISNILEAAREKDKEQGVIMYDNMTYSMLVEMVVKIFNLDPNVWLNLSFNLPSNEMEIKDDRDTKFFVECASNSTDGIPHLYVGKRKKTDARIIPCPVGILQKALHQRNADVMEGGHDNVMPNQ
ncbi:F-box domain containing protein [Tanacetum coccineum]